MKIGVVCEGSNDFVVLEEITAAISGRSGREVSMFDAIQPKIDATSQITGGGWGRVKGWCEQNCSAGLRKYLDQPLFAASVQYDLLLIHIDGDVADILDEDPFEGYSTAANSVCDTVALVKSTVKHAWLQASEDVADRIVVAVPVLHTDAWIAGSHLQVDWESSPMKDTVSTEVLAKYSGKKRRRYRSAARECCLDLDRLRANCRSYDAFHQDFENSLPN